jgi:glycosyltransferase involved in cell wall biosynthesis
MAKIGVVIEGGDEFFKPLELHLRQAHQLTRFTPRFVRAPVIGTSTNKLLLEVQLSKFLSDQDVVMFEWAGPLLAKVSHLRRTCPLVVRLHSIELATSAHLVDWSRVDLTIVVSDHIRRRLLAVAKTPPKLVVVIPFGVNLERFQPIQREYSHRLGMACSILPIKRIYEAILSVAELRQDGYSFTLDVVGGPGEGDALRYYWALQALIEKLGLQGTVTLHGYRPDIPVWLHDIDIFLSNSYWEGQQNALLEAMASGCYCLGHCWGGVQEVLPVENTFVTNRDLCSKLLSYAGMGDEKRLEQQHIMRALAEARFDEKRMVREIVEIIETAAQKK